MPQSPELAAGEGFDFEDVVAAFYLTKMLAEDAVPAMDGGKVVQVGVQQRDFGEPLDDVIVDFETSSGQPSRLSLQAKQSLTISDAKTNDAFREVIRDSWKTLRKDDFREGVDRFGGATEKISSNGFEDLKSLCELARGSLSVEHFEKRFTDGGNANKAVSKIKDAVSNLLTEEIGRAVEEHEIYRFLKHFLVLRFDLMREVAADRSGAVNSIRGCLANESIGSASLVWERFRTLAGEKGSKSGQLDRRFLLRLLGPLVRLKGSRSIQEDARKIEAISSNHLAQIQDGIGKVQLERPKLIELFEVKFESHRFLQIRGLPGVGKSVLLRRLVQKAMANGPTIFLKSEEIKHSSWIQFSQAHGIEVTDLKTFLLEFGAITEPVLYLDAIDRLDSSYQPLIREILSAISSDDDLGNWKVVVSLRDTGIEALQLWLGDILNRARFGTMEVDLLSDEEAESLGEKKPHLRGILFGAEEVRKIVRRPFFAKILDQGFGQEDYGLQEPKSEVELLENWWNRGGYNPIKEKILPRQRGLLNLATAHSMSMSEPISLNHLDSVSEIEELIVDGILQEVESGVSVKFSHDIFFEWSFVYALRAAENGWMAHIRRCGEPPAAARSVELLSQQKFSDIESWGNDLAECDSDGLRSQWLRAWLFGPFHLVSFGGAENDFIELLTENDKRYLKRLLVWFQAEKTVPNQNILESALPAESVQYLAYAWSWPSDFPLWQNMIKFLQNLLPQVSSEVYPLALGGFEVWQNACAGFRNSGSQILLNLCSEWLTEMDSEGSDLGYFNSDSKWKDINNADDFRDDVAKLLMNASSADSRYAEAYLRRLMESADLREGRVPHVFVNSMPLAKAMPTLLVDFTLIALRKDLPEEKKKSSDQERSDFLRHQSFNRFDWDKLSISETRQSFYPISPLKEPFHSLFLFNPEEALRLLRELCNHATFAWRQLHKIDDKGGTPLPLELEFPWGKEVFWGCFREYRYFRGVFGPKALSCGLMAAEAWAFKEIEEGKDVDEVIQKLVEGNPCVSILGVAAMVAMEKDTISAVSLPLFTSQRLLSYDLARSLEDQTDVQANLIGFMGNLGSHHLEAVREMNARLVRKRTLRDLIPAFVFGEKGLSEKACALLAGLGDNLPFEFEEHREIKSVEESLKEDAKRYADLANHETYKAHYVDEDRKQIAIQHESPSAQEPAVQQKLKEIDTSLQESYLAGWAGKSLEEGKISENYSVEKAVEIAQEAISDGRLILKEDAAEESLLELRIAGIAGVVAVVLTFREALSREVVLWARKTLGEVRKIPEIRGRFWMPDGINGLHRGHFIVKAIASEIRSGSSSETVQFDLLSYCSYPLECVATTAFVECVKLWDDVPYLSWAACRLSLDLCHILPRPEENGYQPNALRHSEERLHEAVNRAFDSVEHKNFHELTGPPPAWVKGEPGRYPRGARRRRSQNEDKKFEWRDPEVHWNTKKAGEILKSLPLKKLLKGETKEELLKFVQVLVTWTIEKNSPPWTDDYERDRASTDYIEWNHRLGEFLGELTGCITFEHAQSLILEPICQLPDRTCWSIFDQLVSQYICINVLDAKEIEEDTIDVLSFCLERFLRANEFKRKDPDEGFRFVGDSTSLRTFFFVSIADAPLSTRFANGDWKQITPFLPLINRLVMEGSHLTSVVESFATICDRAKPHYPAGLFCEQTLEILSKVEDGGRKFQKLGLTSRIAELVQYFSQRLNRKEVALSQQLLRILDFLVDFGDRKAAALQQNTTFREVCVSHETAVSPRHSE